MCIKAFTRLEQWGAQADMIETKFRKEDDILLKRVLVSDWLKSEIQDLTTSYKRGQQVMSELRKGYDSLLEQNNLVKSNVKMVSSELDHLKEKLENCINELSLTCKRQDRAQSKAVAALSFGGLGDMPDPNKQDNTVVEEEPKEETKSETEQSNEVCIY